jgi:DNA-binding protein
MPVLYKMVRLTVIELDYTKPEVYIKETGKTISEMVTDYSSGKMENAMKETMMTIKEMALGYTPGVMENTIKASGKMINVMVKESFSEKMEG